MSDQNSEISTKRSLSNLTQDMDSSVRWMMQRESIKFKKLCLMHLSFLLDLQGSDFEALIGDFSFDGDHKKVLKCDRSLFKAWSRMFNRASNLPSLNYK